MAKGSITFQILDGIDKGRLFRDLATPVTVGREEGNTLRLNDERVSRFHAKVQVDSDDYILTDLESTNGTRVNGTVVQIRRLRYGDRISVGRSILLFGSTDEISARMAHLGKSGIHPLPPVAPEVESVGGTIDAKTLAGQIDSNLDFQLNLEDKIRATREAIYIGNKALPPLPLKLTASQAARLAEVLDFMHQGLTEATENIEANEEGTQIKVGYGDWQRIMAVQMLLARYSRLIAEPPEMEAD